jgi:hypothetical protein
MFFFWRRYTQYCRWEATAVVPVGFEDGDVLEPLDFSLLGIESDEMRLADSNRRNGTELNDKSLVSLNEM